MKRLACMLIIGAISLILVNNPFTDLYVSQLKMDNPAVTAVSDPLIQRIEEESPKYYIAPQDAKIDPVWKAIPGYNGVKVDTLASYKKMKSDRKFDPDKLVLKQIEPEKKLGDLPPAPVYKGNPDKPMVSFIINVAWGNEYLSGMLATLKKHKVTATFFLEGRWVQQNPDLAKMITEAGHEAGNHSFTHPDMKTLSSARIREEIEKTNQVIKATTGQEVTWFAPPSGSYRDETVQIAAEKKLKTVMWSLDTVDWRKPSPEELLNRVVPKIHNGAIILMHPTDSTAKSLDRLIMQIKEKDLEIASVSRLLSEERIMDKTLKEKQDFGKNNNNEIY
ncbi:polysaccharide deacetylase family protein [Bacillus infantis]|uniref:polysaccharide deacetylase family protein n=1 Tax=Bacillus infantis TaxID=324767 RepID=UPI002155F317|nr:polysaccharide deacetylase family protein [Bacillus infantis]MCR6610521.1 polysaccharide deacetylase family protein [Bacillus infantis]